MCQFCLCCFQSSSMHCFFVIFHMSFPCNKNLRLASGDGFELQVSPSCAALSPGEACLIGCRWPFVGQVVIAQCPVGNTDRFQAGAVGDWHDGFSSEGLTGPLGVAWWHCFVENLMGHRVIDGYVQTRCRRASRIASCCHWKKHVMLNTRMELPKCETVRENWHIITYYQHHHLDNRLLNFNFGLRFVKFSIMTVQSSFLEVKSYGIA